MCVFCLTWHVQAEESKSFTAQVKTESLYKGVKEALETRLVGKKQEVLNSTFASATLSYKCQIEAVANTKPTQYKVAFQITAGGDMIAAPQMLVEADKEATFEIADGLDSLQIAVVIKE